MKCVHILLPLGNLKALLNSPGVLEPLGMAVPEPLPASKYSRLEIYRALPRPKNVNIVGASSTRVFPPPRHTALERLRQNKAAAAPGVPGFKGGFSSVGDVGACALPAVALCESSRSVLMRPEGGGGLGGKGATRHRFIWSRPAPLLTRCTIIPSSFPPRPLWPSPARHSICLIGAR